MRKVMIGGMKLSSELALVKLQHLPEAEPHRWRIWEKLTSSRINIFFLSSVCTGTLCETAFCVAAEDAYDTKVLIQPDGFPNKHIFFIPAVGALSLFPHHFSFEVLGLSLYAFGKAGLPLYGLASSISSLTFITDYALLEKASTTMEECLVLPEGQNSVKN